MSELEHQNGATLIIKNWLVSKTFIKISKYFYFSDITIENFLLYYAKIHNNDSQNNIFIIKLIVIWRASLNIINHKRFESKF